MKVEREESYLKIYDNNGYLLAYFQPDYGEISPKEREEEMVFQMIERNEPINSGLLYLPMLKMNLDQEHDINTLINIIDDILIKVRAWLRCINNIREIKSSRVVRAHTDPDMLALLLDIKFEKPIGVFTNEMNSILLNIIERFINDRLL